MPSKRRRYHEGKDFERSQLTILPSLAEADVLHGDIYGLIAPYATANFWVLPTWLQHSQRLTLKNSGGLTSASFIIDTTTLFPQPAPASKVSSPHSPSPKSRQWQHAPYWTAARSSQHQTCSQKPFSREYGQHPISTKSRTTAPLRHGRCTAGTTMCSSAVCIQDSCLNGTIISEHIHSSLRSLSPSRIRSCKE